MATLPVEHPLKKTISKANAKGYVKSHPSPIHELLHTYEINPKRLETVSAIRDNNRSQIQVNTYIAQTKEAAIKDEREDTSEIKIFTDGSIISGGVGAAAVIYKRGNKIKTVRKHLGAEQEHTVYEAECAAILMGIHIVKRWKYKNITIYVDNQAALQGLTGDTPGPGKYIMDAIHKELKEMKKKNKGTRIRLRWIPGHQGVVGNETVDGEAKAAAGGQTSNKKDLPKMLQTNIPTSKTAKKQHFHEKLKAASAERWKQYAARKFMSKTAPDFPTKKHCEKLGELTRRGASAWTQLKTGHVGLNKHLFRINVVESPKCPGCKKYDETVEHYLLHCKTYTQERKQLKQKVKGGMRTIGRLLGNHKNAEAVIKYVKETGRLRWMKGEGNGREGGGNERAERRREREGVEEERRGEGRNRRAGNENG